MITYNQKNGIPVASNVPTSCELKGLSTDTKPTDVGVNSLFLELDTGDFYYYTGETWAKVGGNA